jgi:hypothetical protein
MYPEITEDEITEMQNNIKGLISVLNGETLLNGKKFSDLSAVE